MASAMCLKIVLNTGYILIHSCKIHKSSDNFTLTEVTLNFRITKCKCFKNGQMKWPIVYALNILLEEQTDLDFSGLPCKVSEFFEW